MHDDDKRSMKIEKITYTTIALCFFSFIFMFIFMWGSDEDDVIMQVLGLIFGISFFTSIMLIVLSLYSRLRK